LSSILIVDDGRGQFVHKSIRDFVVDDPPGIGLCARRGAVGKAFDSLLTLFRPGEEPPAFVQHLQTVFGGRGASTGSLDPRLAATTSKGKDGSRPGLLWTFVWVSRFLSSSKQSPSDNEIAALGACLDKDELLAVCETAMKMDDFDEAKTTVLAAVIARGSVLPAAVLAKAKSALAAAQETRKLQEQIEACKEY
jgi:hypothetical protein